MAAADLVRLSAHALRNEALQLRSEGAVVRRHDVGGRLRSPSDTIELLCEQVDSRREVRRPNYLLLLFGKVSRLPSGPNATRKELRLTQLEALFWFQRMLSTLLGADVDTIIIGTAMGPWKTYHDEEMHHDGEMHHHH